MGVAHTSRTPAASDIGRRHLVGGRGVGAGVRALGYCEPADGDGGSGASTSGGASSAVGSGAVSAAQVVTGAGSTSTMGASATGAEASAAGGSGTSTAGANGATGAAYVGGAAGRELVFGSLPVIWRKNTVQALETNVP